MKLLAAIVISFAVSSASAQLQTPRPSPKATVMQTIGITDVTITYCRPGVKNRQIWGALVPYGQVWRTGANEMTTITFTDSATVEGNAIPAGTYGIHTIPGETEWTVILTKEAKPWTSYSYKEANEFLRIKVKPESAPMTERLTFSFEDVTESSARVVMHWEKVRIGFDVAVDAKALTLAAARKAVTWTAPYQAALFCVDQSVNLDDGLRWIDISITIEPTYWNHAVKARLLEKTGKTAEAVKTMETAMELTKKMTNAPGNKAQMESLLAEWKTKLGKKK
jgi:hypothetical protein